MALAGIVQGLEHRPRHQRIMGSIPSQYGLDPETEEDIHGNTGDT